MKTKKTGIAAIFVAAIIITACFGVLGGAAADAAEQSDTPYYYKLNYGGQKGYANAADGYTIPVYVQKDAYANLTRITYDRVQLKSVQDEVTGLTASNGVISGDYTVLENDIEVKKSDLVLTDNGTEKYAYVFYVHADSICAFAFTVYYQVSEEDGEQACYDSDILYCVYVDGAAPSWRKISSYWKSGQCQMTFKLSDVVTGYGSSGLKSVTVYRQAAGSDEYTVVGTQTLSGSSATYGVTVDYGKYSYYIEVIDNVGNTTGKAFVVEFSSSTYNEAFEKDVRNALADMENGGYSSVLSANLSSEYSDYLTVISDADSTTEQKDAALAELRKVYAAYYSAKTNSENGVVDFTTEVVNGDYLENFTVKNANAALSFAPKGDTLLLTFTLGVFDTDKVDKKEELEKAGLDKADTLYTFTVKTESECDGTVKTTFSSPIVLSFSLSDYDEAAAVQVVYDTNGNKTYYDCNLVEYADGTVAVSAPYSAGVVNVFTYKKSNKNLYWLFSLAAIPLTAGVVCLIYGRRRLKRKNADAEKESNGARK
jgi:hypothetical protein